MTETVLPLAISGAEIKKAILDKVSIALNKDCNLNDSLAYADGFSFEMHISYRAKDMGREIGEEKDINVALKAEMRGDQQVLVPADPREFESLDAADANIAMMATDPTAARIETGQDVPIKSTDKTGKSTIQNAKYRRDAVVPHTR